MLAIRPVGRGAAAKKYDVLTALGALALSMGKHEQKRILRFITLITARYNWNRDNLSIGQKEIAKLWSCDERTVKREMARFRSQGWLVVRRQGARGRVTEYRMDLLSVLAATKTSWSSIGPDFVERLGEHEATPDVIPFPSHSVVPPPEEEDGTEWASVRRLLHQEDPGTYGAWIRALEQEGRTGGTLSLRAPTKFHATYVATHLVGRIVLACQSVDETITDIRILS